MDSTSPFILIFLLFLSRNKFNFQFSTSLLYLSHALYVTAITVRHLDNFHINVFLWISINQHTTKSYPKDEQFLEHLMEIMLRMSKYLQRVSSIICNIPNSTNTNTLPGLQPSTKTKHDRQFSSVEQVPSDRKLSIHKYLAIGEPCYVNICEGNGEK